MTYICFDTPEWVTRVDPEHGDVRLAVYRAGPDISSAGRPPVIFLHGFPELAYSWRYQMAFLAEKGHPVLALDMRGYGRSDKPQAVDAYSMACLTADVEAVLDAYGIEKAIAVGHDWGALVLWSLPFYIPGRWLGLAGLNVAHTAPYPVDPIELFRTRLGAHMYIVAFQEEGKAEALLDRDAAASMAFFLRKRGRDKNRAGLQKEKKDELAFSAENLELLRLFEAGEDSWQGVPLLCEEETAYYANFFKAGGFRGPVNWYRNMSSNWQAQKAFLKDGVLPKITEPVLMITADMDKACPARLADGMPALCEQLTRVDLKACGHWSQQEQPGAVNSALWDWLSFGQP